MGELTFAFAATLDGRVHAWSAHLVDHGPGRVVDTVAERRSVLARPYRLLVLPADSPLADPTLVERLQRQGRAVMAVWDPAVPRSKDLALRLGADVMVEADASAEEFVRTALALAGERPELAEQVVVERRAAPSAPPPVRVPPSRGRRGGALRLVVCGPGAPESAVVAVELARAAADGRRRIVVVDANELTPSVAQQLSLPVLPNLRIAVDALRSRHHRVGDALMPVPDGGFWVLGGLADPAQWAEVTPAEVAAVVDELAQGCELIVAHGGPVAEDLAGYGGPDRFGITRRLLAEADAVVSVAPATPAGVAQLSAWMADVRLAAPGVGVHLALVRAPADRFRRADLTERLTSDLAPASVTLLPDDGRVERAAWDGGLVRRGPFRRAVGNLAAAVADEAKANGGRHRG